MTRQVSNEPDNCAGGEEFAVCPKCRLADPFLGNERRLYQSVSAGIDRDGWFCLRFRAKCEQCNYIHVRDLEAFADLNSGR